MIAAGLLEKAREQIADSLADLATKPNSVVMPIADGCPVSAIHNSEAAETGVRKVRDESSNLTSFDKDDPRGWSTSVRQWEAFKSIKALHAGPKEKIPEAVLRANIALRLGIQPEEVTADQLLHEIVQLIRHYGIVEVIATPAPSESPRSDDVTPEEPIRPSAPQEASIKGDPESLTRTYAPADEPVYQQESKNPVQTRHLPATEREAPNKDVVDFSSDPARESALAAYRNYWACSNAALARSATVHPSDLSKWKKGLLPAGSDKKLRIEKSLRNNAPTTALPKRSRD
jgi:hypothetical protein